MVTTVSSLTILLTIVSISFSQRDTDVVFLQLKNSTDTSEIPITFVAFGQVIQLKLQRNDNLLSPYFQIWRHDADQIEISELNNKPHIHYLHEDGVNTAAVSFCDEGLQGLILMDDITLEITPLQKEDRLNLENVESDEDIPHLIKRSRMPTAFTDFLGSIGKRYTDPIKSRAAKNSDELTVELAVFFDEPGYTLFAPFFDRSEQKMRDMLLAYINAIQALFYHPSLGARVNIGLVRLDLMKQQPTSLPHHNGERLKLLNSFCNYSAANNPISDDHPNHWDIGLYVSGLDFYANENGKRDGVTMGLATVSGVCLHEYSCVIAELGVSNQFGKPYPSAGFTSVYIAAHEIGHNLGMHHDSSGNSCARDGFIMSSSRGVHGETIWSSCSRDVALQLPETKPCLLDRTAIKSDKTLDHSRFLTVPGREWTAKKQCELLLRDRDASVVTMANACQALQCRTPHRSGYYFAGPALDGTVCGPGKECRGGECLPALHFFFKPTPRPLGGGKKGWSKWKEDSCTSGCIRKSRGALARRRVCNNYSTARADVADDCSGVSYDVKLCNDGKLCKKRITAEEFATLKCRDYSEHLPQLDREASGLQAPHEIERPWMACAIFCRRRDIASYYTPRIELNDLGLDPYFPDGTWCHNEANEDYFCLQHHCLPSSFRFAKDALSTRSNNGDVKLGPQNAHAHGYTIPDNLIRYLSLGINGLPLSKTLSDNFTLLVNDDDDEWADKDYVELPQAIVHPTVN